MKSKFRPSDDRATRGSQRAILLEEAARTLNRHGVSQISLSEIAGRVGVSRAALYYYFEDQQDLVFQSYRRSCEMMARRLSEATRGDGSAMAVLDRFIDGMLGSDADEFAALSEAAYLRTDQRNTIIGLYEAILSAIGEILRRGAQRGELRACATGIVAQAIIGYVSWIPMARRWRTSDPLSLADMVHAIKSLLRHGIAADRSAALAYRAMDLHAGAVPMERVFDAGALAAARREALLAAASWLFNLKGVDATSLEEVALRVGVTKKVIYHNVGDKVTLVLACYRRSFAFYESVAARASDYKGSRLAAVCAATHALAEAALREDIAPLAPLAGFESLSLPAKIEFHESAQRLMARFIDLYAAGAREGSIRDLHARAVLAVHPGRFQWLPKWFDMLTADERAAAPGELAELTRLGLAGV